MSLGPKPLTPLLSDLIPNLQGTKQEVNSIASFLPVSLFCHVVATWSCHCCFQKSSCLFQRTLQSLTFQDKKFFPTSGNLGSWPYIPGLSGEEHSGGENRNGDEWNISQPYSSPSPTLFIRNKHQLSEVYIQHQQSREEGDRQSKKRVEGITARERSCDVLLS